ncbi:MAG: hypothetical protein PVG75_13665 [Thioalkalispiraceae bacterium]|jgi:hypothetical protein
MSFNDVFLIVPNPFLSGLIWFIVIVAVMYFARTPAHLAIISFCRVFHNAMRLSARAVMRAEARLNARNREVLLAQGREATERIIEREFDRVDATVRRDLAEYPSLHRQLSEEITQIDDDYKDSTEVPPEPPAWVKAVDAVAKIPGKDPMVASILEDIHSSMVKANTQAIEEYRKSSHKRHEHLKNMMPHWRKVRSILGQVDKSVTSLLTRSQTIDRHMDEYEQIVKESDRSVRMLSSSSLTHFFISALVLAIAVGGGMINFELIAYPMSQMVEGKREIGTFEVSSVAALVIILVEISMGIFLMELLRVTKLFPVIGSLNDKLRIKMAWTAFGFLFGLACVEAGLAFMREVMVEIDQAQRTGAAFDAPTWILTAAQMGLGFILPFALMFVAIPLETFVHSLRTVLGIVGIGLLRGLAWLLRFIGSIMRFLAKMLVNAYDFVIFAPLWVERKLKNKDVSDSERLDSATTTL